MKKILIAFALTLVGIQIKAQALSGQNIYQNIAQNSTYLLSNQDDSDVLNDLKEYTKQINGKFSELSKNIYRIDKIRNNAAPSEISTVDVSFENSKRVLKVAFFFFDKNQKILATNEANTKVEQDFVSSFSQFTNNSLMLKLLENQVKNNKNNLDDANKDVSKLEKKIANNLDDQEKLGKKLDQSPDLLAKALADKQEILNKATADSLSAIDPKLQSDIQKASSKKEKEIAKIQKETEKANSKLDKKSNAYEELKSDLAKAKAFQKETETIYNDSQALLNKLKR